MKSFIVIFAICAIAVVSSELTEENKKRKAETISFCKTKLNYDDEVAKIMDLKISPENEQQKCFLDCVYTKMGILKDNKLYSEGVKALAQRKFGDDQEKLKKADDLFNKCVAEVGTDNGEKCYHGKAIRDCILRHNTLFDVFGA